MVRKTSYKLLTTEPVLYANIFESQGLDRNLSDIGVRLYLVNKVEQKVGRA